MSNPNGEKALVFTWGEESLTRQLLYHGSYLEIKTPKFLQVNTLRILERVFIAPF